MIALHEIEKKIQEAPEPRTSLRLDSLFFLMRSIHAPSLSWKPLVKHTLFLLYMISVLWMFDPASSPSLLPAPCQLCLSYLFRLNLIPLPACLPK